MEERFTNKTDINNEELYKFQLLELKKFIYLSSSLLGIVSIIVGLLFLFFVKLYLGVIVIILGMVCAVFLLPFIIKDGIKKQNERLFTQNKIINEYEFYEDFFSVKAKLQREDGIEEEKTEKYEYKNLFKISDYSIFIFIYINSRQSFILDKRKMIKGTSGELIEFLQSKNIKINKN